MFGKSCLKGKTAIVTGAAHGIGRGIAIQFAKNGARLILNDSDKDELGGFALDLYTAVANIVSADFFDNYGRKLILANDPDECRRENGRPEAIDEFNLADIIIVNPYWSTQGPALAHSDRDFLQILEKNLVSYFSMARMYTEHCLAYGRPEHIIFMASEFGMPDMLRTNSLGYDVAKAGIIKMTRILAKEWLGINVRVNSIAPGATDTLGEREFMAEEELRAAWRGLPANRACSPEEIGLAAVYLAANPMVNGEVLRVNGGEHLA